MLETIAENPRIARILPPSISSVKNSAMVCYQEMYRLDEMYEKILGCLWELYCTIPDGASGPEEQANLDQVNLIAQQGRLMPQVLSIEETIALDSQLSKYIETVVSAFKSLADSSSGLDAIKLPAVVDLLFGVNSAVSQFISAVARNKLQDPLFGDGAGRILGAYDPATAQVIKDLVFLSALQATLKGPGGGVDWDKARGSIESIQGKLGESKAVLQAQGTQREPTSTYKGVLETAIRIASEVKAALDAGPGGDSTKESQWQTDFGDVYAKALKLVASARTLPGLTIRGGPVVGDFSSLSSANSATPGATGLAEYGKNELNLRSQVATGLSEAKRKTIEKSGNLKGDILQISNELTRLGRESGSLRDVKRALFHWIKLVGITKSQIENLARAFNALGKVFDTIINSVIEPLVDSVQLGSVEESGSTAVGGFSIINFQSSILVQSFVTIMGYFESIKECTRMWDGVLGRSLPPLVDLTNKMMQSSPGLELQKTASSLDRFSQDASQEIQVAIDQDNKDGEYEGDILRQKAEANSQQFPALDKAALDAIKGGVGKVKEEIFKAAKA
ncbi:hypothetical protein ABW19_dt0205030 [Dactylella cylindrospora]|nr:hypothetical protein ABW19_dt0205030 [Dactylella cylindrospora]